METMRFKNIVIDGADFNDHPDYVDAYVSYAEHPNGDPLTDRELDKLNEDNPEIAQSLAFESLI